MSGTEPRGTTRRDSRTTANATAAAAMSDTSSDSDICARLRTLEASGPRIPRGLGHPVHPPLVVLPLRPPAPVIHRFGLARIAPLGARLAIEVAARHVVDARLARVRREVPFDRVRGRRGQDPGAAARWRSGGTR